MLWRHVTHSLVRDLHKNVDKLVSVCKRAPIPPSLALGDARIITLDSIWCTCHLSHPVPCAREDGAGSSCSKRAGQLGLHVERSVDEKIEVSRGRIPRQKGVGCVCVCTPGVDQHEPVQVLNLALDNRLAAIELHEARLGRGRQIPPQRRQT